MKRTALLLAVLALAGCETTQTTHVTTGPARSPVLPETVRVIQSPPTNAVMIAIVTAHALGSGQVSADRAREALRKESAQVGADMLLITDYKIQTGRSACYWLSGKAFGTVKDQ